MDKKPEYNPWETDPNLIVDDATADYIIKNTPLKFWHSHAICNDYEVLSDPDIDENEESEKEERVRTPEEIESEIKRSTGRLIRMRNPDALPPAHLESLTDANAIAHFNMSPESYRPSPMRERQSTENLLPKDFPGYADIATRPRTRMSPVEGLPDDWFWIDEPDFTGHIQTPGPEIAEYDLHAHSICIDGAQKINPAYTPDEAGLEFMKKDALPDIKRFIAKRVIVHDKPFEKKKENVSKKSPEKYL